MKKFYRLATLIAFLGAPLYAVAAQTGINTAYIKSYSDSIIYIINSILVPTLIALAFIVFLFGIYRYFIQGAASDTERATGRQFALWGIIGFVIIVSLWGIVNLFTSTLGLTASNVPSFPAFSTGTYVPASGGAGGTGGCNPGFKPNPAIPGQCVANTGGSSATGGGSTLGGGGSMTPAQSSALTALQGQYATCISSGSPYNSAACTTYKTALSTYNSAFPSSSGDTTYQRCIDNGSEPLVCQCEASGGAWNLTDQICSNSSGGGAGGTDTSAYQACISRGGNPATCQCEAGGGAWDLNNNTCSNSRTCTALRDPCVDAKGVSGSCGDYNGALRCFGGLFPDYTSHGLFTCSNGTKVIDESLCPSGSGGTSGGTGTSNACAGDPICECEAGGGIWNSGDSVCE